VVGPAGSVAALEREVSRIPELLGRLRESRASWTEWAAATRPDSAEGLLAREGVAAFGVGIADIEKGVHPRPPTDTFTARRTMEVGGIRLELFVFTGLHSDSDILILVPAEKLLFTGDVFWGGQLPVLRVGSEGEFRRMLEHWDAILALAPDVERVVPGHSDVPMTVEEFRAMHAYLSRLWSDVRSAREAGTGVLQFLLANVFAERYPEVAGIDPVRRGYNLHQHNIYTLWHLLDG
jgi:glyoxylase-like metal-dependent hydrolase (beta-lactamase superfamily II)